MLSRVDIFRGDPCRIFVQLDKIDHFNLQVLISFFGNNYVSFLISQLVIRCLQVLELCHILLGQCSRLLQLLILFLHHIALVVKIELHLDSLNIR